MADRNNKRSLRNLIGSLVVTCGAALIFYVLVVPRGDGDSGVQRVSFAQELDQARRVAPYAVAAPEGLSDGWRATSVTYQGTGDHGATWHLGFVTPDDEYVGVEQGSKSPEDFISKVTYEAKRTGDEQRVAGEDWARYEGPKYNALVRGAGDATTVVTGTASFAQLAKMAGALQAEKTEAQG